MRIILLCIIAGICIVNALVISTISLKVSLFAAAGVAIILAYKEGDRPDLDKVGRFMIGR